MKEFEYKAFVESSYQGRVVVGVDRVFARKLYTDVPIFAIEEATGEAPYFEKLVVWFALLVSPLAILGSASLAVVAFRWWAILIIPAAFFLWMSNKSMSVRGDSAMWLLTLILIVAGVIHFTNIFAASWISGFVTAFAFALWCDRLLYCASTAFLRAFVLRNQRAFEAFQEGLVIREAGADG